MTRHRIFLSIAVVSVLAFPALVHAEDLVPVDSFFFTAGIYHADNDVKLRMHPKNGSVPGSHVDVKRDLGLDMDGAEGFFEVGGSFAREGSSHRHKFEAFHYGYDSSSSLSLSDDYQIGDDVFAEGADFEGNMEVKLLGVSYTWLFHNTDSSALGVGLGAIRYDVTAALGASSIVNGELETASAAIDEASWVPQIHGEYVKLLSDHWRVGVDASYIKKSGGKFSGDAVDLTAKLEYFPWRHVGFSLRYNYNDISLKFKKSSFTGDVDVKTRGPQLAATVRF